jgi:hypothetical protein
MVETREELERKVKAQQDALDYAVNAAQAARRLIELYVPLERRGSRDFKQLYTIVEAVAKQSGFAGPAIAAYAHRSGLLDGALIGESVAKRGNDEWRAGAETVIEEIRKKAGHSL